MKDTPEAVQNLYRTLIMHRSGIERLKMGCTMFDTARALARANLRLTCHTDDELRVGLFVERVELRLRCGKTGPCLIELLRRDHALLLQVLRARVRHARLLEIRRRRFGLCLGRRERRFGLRDLIRHLPLLVPQRRFRLAHLRRQPLDVLRVVRGLGLQLVRPEDGDQLITLDGVSLLHEQLK